MPPNERATAYEGGEVLGLCCWEEVSEGVLYVEELFSVVKRGGLAAGAVREAMRKCAGGNKTGTRQTADLSPARSTRAGRSE